HALRTIALKQTTGYLARFPRSASLHAPLPSFLARVREIPGPRLLVLDARFSALCHTPLPRRPANPSMARRTFPGSGHPLPSLHFLSRGALLKALRDPHASNLTVYLAQDLFIQLPNTGLLQGIHKTHIRDRPFRDDSPLDKAFDMGLDVLLC